MESYLEICATREQFRKASALALDRHWGTGKNPGWAFTFLKSIYVVEEFDVLEMLATSPRWLPEEKASMIHFAKYARLAWNLEIAEAARVHLNSETAEEVANAPW